MRKFFPYLLMGLLVLAFTIPATAQVTLRTGSIAGKVLDDQGQPLPGVAITLESTQIPTQTATSLSNGTFRFANLPPATYSVNFSLEGFTEVRQEEVRVSVGSTIQLDITLKASLTEEFTVIGETPVVNTTKAENESTYNREYLNQIPSGRDPWVILDQTPGIGNDRYNVAGSESGQQSGFFARGASDTQNTWNYDGVNSTDPVSLGASPTYYDFDAFEEIQITSGGSDPSVQTSGVQVNIVTKRGGNQWATNASGFFTNHDLQANNTPEELVASGQDRSNSINEIYEYGLDVGGPIVKDKFFVWGAYRRQQIDLFTATINPFTGQNLQDNTELKDYNFKANYNPSKTTEFQFGYFNGVKNKEGRGFNPPVQSQETLWSQGVPGTILNGLWTGQGTWIPNDKLIVTGRYGYIGNSFSLIPGGGKDIPMIYLAAIPLYEDTSYYVSPIDRPSNDWNADVNYYKEKWLGGDHEFKFGFDYKMNKGHTFSSYGNGLFIVDYYQTNPQGPLTSGYMYAQHFIDGNVRSNRTSLYASDTFRRDRLTLNLGVRMDYQNGWSEGSSIPGVPGGFESFVGPLVYSGNDLSPSFTNFAPRLGATYDLTGDGKTVLRGNFAIYYDPYNAAVLDNYSNPTYVYNGAYFAYTNTNGDRTVTPDEATFLFNYGGWLGNPFNQAAYEANRLYSPDLANTKTDEFVIGFEREVAQNTSVSVNYTYRKYTDIYVTSGVNGGAGAVPVGVTADDFIPGGVFSANTVLGSFNVPYLVYGGPGDGSLQMMENIDGYEQSYNGVDLIFRRRMSNNFMLNSSFSWQDQKATYNGGNSFFVTTGDGLTGITMADPSQVGPLYNDQPYAYVSGGSGKSGVFPYATWTFRASGVYQLPWQMNVGTFVRYQEGYPYVLFGTVTDGSLAGYYGTTTRRILVEPIGSRRFDDLFTMDVNVQKIINMGNAGRFTVSAGIFNLFNENTIIQRNRSIVSSTFNAIQENISGRALRLGVLYSF